MSADGGSGEEPPRGGARQTRWEKGKSGNPKGRPRKNATPDASTPSSTMTELLISEADREVTLSEGGNPVTMSAGQAVLRATLVSALKGNAQSQRTFLQMTTAAQAQSAKSKLEEHEAAFLMQLHVQVERDDCIRRGFDEADFPRHPSDIEINPQTGKVKNFLLYTRDAIDARKRLIALRDFLIGEMPRMLEAAKEDGDDALLARGREQACEMIDFFNERLPVRFRRVLSQDAPVLSGTESPNEIWQIITKQDASLLLDKSRRREGKPRPGRRPPKGGKSK